MEYSSIGYWMLDIEYWDNFILIWYILIWYQSGRKHKDCSGIDIRTKRYTTGTRLTLPAAMILLSSKQSVYWIAAVCLSLLSRPERQLVGFRTILWHVSWARKMLFFSHQLMSKILSPWSKDSLQKTKIKPLANILDGSTSRLPLPAD